MSVKWTMFSLNHMCLLPFCVCVGTLPVLSVGFSFIGKAARPQQVSSLTSDGSGFPCSPGFRTAILRRICDIQMNGTGVLALQRRFPKYFQLVFTVGGRVRSCAWCRDRRAAWGCGDLGGSAVCEPRVKPCKRGGGVLHSSCCGAAGSSTGDSVLAGMVTVPSVAVRADLQAWVCVVSSGWEESPAAAAWPGPWELRGRVFCNRRESTLISLLGVRCCVSQEVL